MLIHFFKPKHPGLDTDRIKAFSDSIFAFAITLLVLNVTLPPLTQTQINAHILLPSILNLWPKIVGFGISFAIIGIFWVGHTIMFHFIKRADRMLLYLNLLLLMSVAFMPFPTQLLSAYSPDQTAVAFYGCVLLVTGLLFCAIWHHSAHNYRLIDTTLDRKIIKKGYTVILFAPLIYAFAIVISFVHPYISLAIYVLVPLLYILPSPVDDLIEAAEKN